MKIIYMHHAEREITKGHNDIYLRQLEDITESGLQETRLLAERMKDKAITAIITSPYIRCKHTAEIINQYHNLPIIEDERFNEKDKDEEWKSFLERNINAINDVVTKYNDNDTIVCMTSGVNLSAFICYFYNQEPTNDTPWTQALSVSPISFTINK